MRFTFPLLILCLMSSCANGANDEPTPVSGNVPISFDISAERVEPSAASRGTTIGFPSDMSEFRLFAALWDKIDNGSYRFMGYEIDNEMVTRGSDNEWATSIPYYWPLGNRYLTFFAYYPAEIEGWRIGNPHSSPEEIRFYYTPPADSKDQHDVLFAFNHEMMNYSGNPSKRVKLTFTHILANIRLNIVGDATQVRYITLKNFYGSGGYHPGGGGVLYNWDYNDFENTAPAPLVNYTVEVPENGILSDTHSLIIIPQQTREDSSIEVTMRDGTVHSWRFAHHTFLPQSIRTINIHLPSDSTDK